PRLDPAGLGGAQGPRRRRSPGHGRRALAPDPDRGVEARPAPGDAHQRRLAFGCSSPYYNRPRSARQPIFVLLASPSAAARPTTTGLAPLGNPFSYCSPRLRLQLALLLARQDFLQEVGGARGGVGADLLFLLAQHHEEPVEALGQHIAVDVQGLGLHEGDGLRAPQQLLVLARDPDLIERLVHDGLEGGGELVAGLALEVLGGRVVAPAPDLPDVLDAHRADGVPEDLLRPRRGRLRGTVHGEDELVELGPIAHHPESLVRALEL